MGAAPAAVPVEVGLKKDEKHETGQRQHEDLRGADCINRLRQKMEERAPRSVPAANAMSVREILSRLRWLNHRENTPTKPSKASATAEPAIQKNSSAMADHGMGRLLNI